MSSLRRLVHKFLRGRADREGVTRSDVVWCYRTLLGRRAESEAVIEHQRSVHGSFRALVRTIADSPEFAELRTRKAAHLRTAQPAAAPTDRVGTPDPAANAALGKAEFAAGVVRVNSLPQLLTLESTSRCNLRCVMCPQGIDAVDRPKNLELELVERLAPALAVAREVQLHGIGEPLGSEAFWRNLELLPEHAESSVNTNFTILDARRLRLLAASRLRRISVSLDAATPQTYRRIRGHDLEPVLDNIRAFLAERARLGKRTPRFQINMTLMRANVEEVVSFIELAASLGVDSVTFGHLNRYDEAEMARYVVTRDDWVFDYRKEGLWNTPELSDTWVARAEEAAARLGVYLAFDQNKSIYFGRRQEGASHVA